MRNTPWLHHLFWIAVLVLTCALLVTNQEITVLKVKESLGQVVQWKLSTGALVSWGAGATLFAVWAVLAIRKTLKTPDVPSHNTHASN